MGLNLKDFGTRPTQDVIKISNGPKILHETKGVLIGRLCIISMNFAPKRPLEKFFTKNERDYSTFLLTPKRVIYLQMSSA